jgi:hypothetical protein
VRRADPSSKESYRMCKTLGNLKSGRGLTKGCSLIYIYIYIYTGIPRVSQLLLPQKNTAIIEPTIIGLNNACKMGDHCQGFFKSIN